MSKITNIKWVREILQKNIDRNGARISCSRGLSDMEAGRNNVCLRRKGG